MKKTSTFFEKIQTWTVPLGLLALLALSFGLLIPKLGFYWDDWSVLITARLRTLSAYWGYYAYDRPFSAWLYVLTVPVLGTNSTLWHIFTLLLRWSTAISLWWALSGLWPQRKREVTLAVFLFAVYPVFQQQAISVAYAQHWSCYLLYAFSLGCMVQAWRKPRYFWPLTVLGVLASIVQIFSMEYFAAIDLLRPFILWLMISETGQKGMRRIGRVLLNWLPYLLVLTGFILWRFFWLKFPGKDPNAPVLLVGLLRHPLTAATTMLQMLLQDSAYMLFTVWGGLFNPQNLQLTDHFIVFSWAIGLAGAIGMFFLLRRREDTESLRKKSWPMDALAIGLLGMWLGALPAWTTNGQVTVGLHSDRFGMASMFGASLALVAILSWLVTSYKKQLVVVCALVAIAISMNIQMDNQYRWAWVSQTRFYWQLAWRAPYIQPHTPIVSSGEVLSYMGTGSITGSISLLYPKAAIPEDQFPYYYVSLDRSFQNTMSDFLGGVDMSIKNRNFTFTGNTKDSLVIDYGSTPNTCLHILTPNDVHLPGLPELTAQAVPNSNLGRILPTSQSSDYPPLSIYGPEPPHAWCYFYEKADLARQLGDWKGAAQFGDQAQAKGYSPLNADSAFEWQPFIEAYARTGQWQQASSLSLKAYQRDVRSDAGLCDLWDRLAADSTLSGQERDAAANAVRQGLKCPTK